MKNKMLSLLIALIVTFSLSYIVMAKNTEKADQASAQVVIEAIDDLALSQDELDEDYGLDVDGYVLFDSSADNINLKSLELLIREKGTSAWSSLDGVSYDEALESEELSGLTGTPSGLEFSFDDVAWSEVSLGKFEVKVIATFEPADSSDDPDTTASAIEVFRIQLDDADEDSDVDEDEDIDDDEDENIDDEDEATNDDDDEDSINESADKSCPAAPALANKILKEEGIPHRYGEGKDGGNYIADVAHEMGKGASLDGIEKKDKVKYKEKVEEVLEDIQDEQED